jgi:hypothetical protein
MRQRLRRLGILVTTTVLLFAGITEGAQKQKPESPVAPPVDGEFYPVSTMPYPQAQTNPNAHARTVPFAGTPLDIFTRINMVTQIQVPAPPVLVNIGREEGFVVDVVPQFNSIFVKPTMPTEMTNLIVTTERGVYLFVLKENPYRPFDMRVVVTDPYRQVTPDDTYSLVRMAFLGTRPAEFQHVTMDIRTPGTTGWLYDPLTKMSLRATLRRAVFLPLQKRAVYWVEFANIVPPDVAPFDTPSASSSFVIDERTVWTAGVERVAVPGTRTGGVPLLARGQKTDVFLVVRAEQIPATLRVRLALSGSREMPVEVVLATTQGGRSASRTTGGVLPATETHDEKLQKLYDQLLKKEGTQTVPYPSVWNTSPDMQPEQENETQSAFQKESVAPPLYPPLDEE